MIITGDIACPDVSFSNKIGKALESNGSIFADQRMVFNLEGLIADDYSPNTSTPVLFNHSSLLKVLQQRTGGSVAALANNHTLDIPEYFDYTIDLLQSHSVPFSGAGKTVVEATKPLQFTEKDEDIFLFNYCWDFLLYHQENPSEDLFVAEIQENEILSNVKACRESNPEASIIVYFHWNIDLEKLPQPIHRQFSRALIDNGANIVVGTHSHCVQGGEKYKSGYIVYGLGNFFIPWNVYANGNLRFPDFSKLSLALEWNPKSNSAICHWFEYDEKENTLHHLSSDQFEDCTRLRKYSPYQGMSLSEYEGYFKTNRRKKFLIPVFKDYRKKWVNSGLTQLLKLRAKTARKLAKLQFIKWQS